MIQVEQGNLSHNEDRQEWPVLNQTKRKSEDTRDSRCWNLQQNKSEERKKWATKSWLMQVM